jgi:hypothetical protein
MPLEGGALANALAGRRLGNTKSEIYTRGRKIIPLIDQLSAEEVRQALTMETTLRRVTETEFDLLLRYGFDVAGATLCAYQSDRFSPIPFVGRLTLRTDGN